MTQSAEADRVWDMMESLDICMLVTRDGEHPRARPMGTYPRRQESCVYFLTDVRHHKDEEIRRFPNVCLAFADTGKGRYLSVTGRAQVSNDRDKIRDLWSTIAKAWWDSADDPNIRLLAVTPEDAEYWDTPGPTVSYVKMMTAAATGGRPDMGDHRKVAM